MKDIIPKNISKGGLLGALVGGIVSSKTYKPSDSTTAKVVKTGLIASIGFAVGAIVERMFVKKK